VIESGKQRVSSRGFTLVEILIAFAILAVALTGLLRAFSGSLHATAKAEHYAAAVLSARSILERVGSEIPMQDGMQSGRTEDGTEWSIRMRRLGGVFDATSDATSGQDDPFLLYEIVVTVAVSHQQPITLTTLRVAPHGSANQFDGYQPEDPQDVGDQP
jgi:general secretion pathway protein I